MSASKNKKKRNVILIVLSIVLIIVVVVLGFLWNTYLNKNNLLRKYETQKKQEVYILGTLHEYHFNKVINYSMEDILSVVENLQPEVVFIEAREEYFKNYSVIDGPIDRAVVYSYCIEKNIPVEMVDWWMIDNKYQSNTTNKKRDDMIFSNINNKLSTFDEGTKVLIVCGTGHLYEQSERFLDNGYRNLKIKNVADLFKNINDFKYPENTEKIWEQRAYFYAYTYPNIIEQRTDLDDEIKTQFTGGDKDAFYIQQLKYCDYFSKNKLYE